MGIAILLAILFGPLGMLYSTVLGGLIMFSVNLLIVLLTCGFGSFLILITWPICVVWAAIAVDSHNKKVMARQR